MNMTNEIPVAVAAGQLEEQPAMEGEGSERPVEEGEGSQNPEEETTTLLPVFGYIDPSELLGEQVTPLLFKQSMHYLYNYWKYC